MQQEKRDVVRFRAYVAYDVFCEHAGCVERVCFCCSRREAPIAVACAVGSRSVMDCATIRNYYSAPLTPTKAQRDSSGARQCIDLFTSVLCISIVSKGINIDLFCKPSSSKENSSPDTYL